MESNMESKVSDSQSADKRTGFTLVELLVVISIIALLLSILMPSLGKVRRKAQSVVCGSNLRQIGIGMQLYLQDNRGTFMTVYGTSISEKAWYTRLVKEGRKILYTDNATEYIPGYDVAFCPSHRLIPWFTKIEKRDYPSLRDYSIAKGFASYGMSSGLSYDYSQAGYPAVPSRIQDIKQAANTVLLADAQGRRTDDLQVVGSFLLRAYYNRGIDDASIRHDGACNVLWVDGHVTSVKVTNPKDPSTIYSQQALTNYSMSNNYWDRK